MAIIFGQMAEEPDRWESIGLLVLDCALKGEMKIAEVTSATSAFCVVRDIAGSGHHNLFLRDTYFGLQNYDFPSDLLLF